VRENERGWGGGGELKKRLGMVSIFYTSFVGKDVGTYSDGIKYVLQKLISPIELAADNTQLLTASYITFPLEFKKKFVM
jgi:hypothetical protein